MPNRSTKRYLTRSAAEDSCLASHLKQEELATRLRRFAPASAAGDGTAESRRAGGRGGKAGFAFSHFDIDLMHHHYDVRALLDGLAARRCARRLAKDEAARKTFEQQARTILADGNRRRDRKRCAGNDPPGRGVASAVLRSLRKPIAACHSRTALAFLRRVMGDVLRKAEPPRDIWLQHEAIVDATLKGKSKRKDRKTDAQMQTALQTFWRPIPMMEQTGHDRYRTTQCRTDSHCPGPAAA